MSDPLDFVTEPRGPLREQGWADHDGPYGYSQDCVSQRVQARLLVRGPRMQAEEHGTELAAAPAASGVPDPDYAVGQAVGIQLSPYADVFDDALAEGMLLEGQTGVVREYEWVELQFPDGTVARGYRYAVEVRLWFTGSDLVAAPAPGPEESST